MKNWVENGILLQEANTGSCDGCLLVEASPGAQTGPQLQVGQYSTMRNGFGNGNSVVTLILIRKLEAGDATCGRLDEEMLGRRFYLAATG